jgi:hypothetical protein
MSADEQCCPGCDADGICYYVTRTIQGADETSAKVRPAGQVAYDWLRINDPDEWRRVPDPGLADTN